MLKIEYFIQFCPNYIIFGIENYVYEVVTFHEYWVKNVELAALLKLVRFLHLPGIFVNRCATIDHEWASVYYAVNIILCKHLPYRKKIFIGI